MELIINFFDFFIHLDRYLSMVIQRFGGWTYLLVFLVIFCETGLVVTPLLPGDSLLFGLGAFAAKGDLEVEWLFIILSVAAVGGDAVNYAAGKFVGPRVFRREDVRFLNREYLDRTHRFYEKYGGKTIVIARFVPIIRTFAPFVAGVGSMTYWRFACYNILGGIFWVAIFIFGGYYFGNLPAVKRNFSLVIFAIIFLSVLPGVIEFFRQRNQRPS
ncbi:MAG: DedA family protein [Syntrophales bacterium]|nr:DedA family protein [Syntrophales bacterium]